MGFRAVKESKCSIPRIEYMHQHKTLIIQTRSPSHGYIQGYDMNKFKQPTFQFDTHCSSFCRFQSVETVNPSDDILIASVGSQRGLLQLWNANKKQIIHQMDFDKLPNKKKRGMIMGVNAFCTTKNSEIVIVCVSESGFIDVYDVRASKVGFSHQFGKNTPLTSMALNKEKTNGICGGSNNILYGFEIDYKLNSFVIRKKLKIKNEGVNVIKIRSFDEKIFGFGGWDARCRLFQFSTFKPLAILKGHKGGITDFDFHSKNNMIATASNDPKIGIYKLY